MYSQKEVDEMLKKARSGRESAAAETVEKFEKMLRDGKLIGAIKIYRDVTGAGLAEAKNEVERIARQRGY